MNNYNALYPLITVYNALYIKALSKVLPFFPIHFFLYKYFKIKIDMNQTNQFSDESQHYKLWFKVK